MSGEGDGDAAVFVTGMVVGAGLAHNPNLAGAADVITEGVPKVGGPAIYGQIAVGIGLVFCVVLGLTARLRAKEVAK